MGAITVSADVLITVTPQLPSAIGRKRLIRAAPKVQKHNNSDVAVEGALLYDERSKSSMAYKDFEKELTANG